MDKNMSRKMLQGEMEEVKKKVYRENQQLIALQVNILLIVTNNH